MIVFREWKMTVREELVAASGRIDKAFRWIKIVEDKEATFGSLGESGKFVSNRWT